MPTVHALEKQFLPHRSDEPSWEVQHEVGEADQTQGGAWGRGGAKAHRLAFGDGLYSRSISDKTKVGAWGLGGAKAPRRAVVDWIYSRGLCDKRKRGAWGL